MAAQMAQAKEFLETKVFSQIDKLVEDNAHVKKVTAMAGGQRAAHVVLAGASLAVITLWLVFGVAALCNLVGYVYPLHASMRALRTQRDQNTWLTYWIVFGVLTILESFAGFLIDYIPCYQCLKMATLVWCFLPQTKGASIVYNTVLKPVFIKIDGPLPAPSVDEEGAEGNSAASDARKAN